MIGMPTGYDVPPNILIKKLAEHLRKMPQISSPAWAPFVKTGSHAERPPQDKDWWYVRCASMLRKVYVHGPIGLSHLESEYGGVKSIGYSLAHHRDAGGSSIRKPLIQLEAAGLVSKKPGEGRIVTSRGRSLIDRISGEIFKDLVKADESLKRYV